MTRNLLANKMNIKSKRSYQLRHNNYGMSLLEVLLAISILATIVLSITQILRYNIDIRLALSEKAKVTQKLNRILTRINADLGQAFLLSPKDRFRTEGERRTIFKILNQFNSDKLMMTYANHFPEKMNAKESSLSYVVYEVKESKKYPHRKDLYRGEFPRVPENFKQDPPMNLIARDIKTIRFLPWRGDDWKKDGWDSTRSETKDLLPHLVQIQIESWEKDAFEGQAEDEDKETVQFSTAVSLVHALDFNELKDRMSSFRM